MTTLSPTLAGARTPQNSGVMRACGGTSMIGSALKLSRVATGAAGAEGSASDEVHPFEENRRADEKGRE